MSISILRYNRLSFILNRKTPIRILKKNSRSSGEAPSSCYDVFSLVVQQLLAHRVDVVLDELDLLL